MSRRQTEAQDVEDAQGWLQYGGTGSYGVVEGGRKPATKRDYRQAIDAARTVVEWAAKRVPAS